MSNSRAGKNTGTEDNSVVDWEKATVIFDRSGGYPDWMDESVYDHAVNSPGHTYLVTDKEHTLGDFDAVFKWSDRKSEQGSRVSDWKHLQEELVGSKQVSIEGDLKAALETYENTIKDTKGDRTVFVDPDHTYVLLQTENDGMSEEYAPLSEVRSPSNSVLRYSIDNSYEVLDSELREKGLKIGRWDEEGEMEEIEMDERLTSPGYRHPSLYQD